MTIVKIKELVFSSNNQKNEYGVVDNILVWIHHLSSPLCPFPHFSVVLFVFVFFEGWAGGGGGGVYGCWYSFFPGKKVEYSDGRSRQHNEEDLKEKKIGLRTDLNWEHRSPSKEFKLGEIKNKRKIKQNWLNIRLPGVINECITLTMPCQQQVSKMPWIHNCL